jgi:hypothetical protein
MCDVQSDEYASRSTALSPLQLAIQLHKGIEGCADDQMVTRTRKLVSAGGPLSVPSLAAFLILGAVARGQDRLDQSRVGQTSYEWGAPAGNAAWLFETIISATLSLLTDAREAHVHAPREYHLAVLVRGC